MAELFEKYSIAGIETKNRIAAGPMARGVAGDGGSIPDNLIGIYRELAEGGVGMMITEVVLVSGNTSFEKKA